MAGLVLRLCRAGGPWVRYVFFASSYNVVSLRRRTTPVPGSRVTAANDRAATRGHSCASAGGLPRRRQMALAPVGCMLDREMPLRRRPVAAALCPRHTITLTNHRFIPNDHFFLCPGGRPSVAPARLRSQHSGLCVAEQ